MTELLAVIRDKERRKTRRSLLIGGAAILAAVALGIVLAQDPGDVWADYRQSEGSVATGRGLPVQHLAEVTERLESDGLTEIVWMGMTTTSIEGDAASPADPARMVAFFRGTDGVVRVAEPRKAEVDRTIGTGTLLSMVEATLDGDISEVSGTPVGLNLIWNPEAVPMIEVNYDDGDTMRVAQFTGKGELDKEYEG